ncbi:MAG TPA: nickel-dependent lactate racemase [Dehalococcoidia bacterium]|nr:nickel-dependent lactate racemase [Dehalococcoidia bacterium]
MRVPLPFGRSQVEVEVPDTATVLRPRAVPPLADPEGAVRELLRSPTFGPPLRDLARGAGSAAIVISDVTRPVPNRLLLPALIEELNASGIPDAGITILNGTGLHRPNTEAELREMLGDLAESYRIVQHEARRRETLVEVGRSARGAPVELCRTYVEADLRIVTGFVEPHLFAGYSGGAKGVMPGVAGAEIVMSNHGAENLSHPRARWCVAAGNPVFDEMRAIAGLCPPHFLLNVTLDSERRITGAFAGDWRQAHDAAIEQAARQHTVAVPGPFDIVVVTNMGYPADLNLYQSVKGMSVAAEAVREGGSILLVAACEDGLGSDDYVRFLTGRESPEALLASILGAEAPRHDQWQVQVQAMVQRKAAVYLHSRLSREATEAAHLRYSANPSETLARLIADARSQGLPGSVLVLPHGQLTVPVIA